MRSRHALPSFERWWWLFYLHPASCWSGAWQTIEIMWKSGCSKCDKLRSKRNNGHLATVMRDDVEVGWCRIGRPNPVSVIMLSTGVDSERFPHCWYRHASTHTGIKQPLRTTHNRHKLQVLCRPQISLIMIVASLQISQRVLDINMSHHWPCGVQCPARASNVGNIYNLEEASPHVERTNYN